MDRPTHYQRLTIRELEMLIVGDILEIAELTEDECAAILNELSLRRHPEGFDGDVWGDFEVHLLGGDNL